MIAISSSKEPYIQLARRENARWWWLSAISREPQSILFAVWTVPKEKVPFDTAMPRLELLVPN